MFLTSHFKAIFDVRGWIKIYKGTDLYIDGDYLIIGHNLIDPILTKKATKLRITELHTLFEVLNVSW